MTRNVWSQRFPDAFEQPDEVSAFRGEAGELIDIALDELGERNTAPQPRAASARRRGPRKAGAAKVPRDARRAGQ